VRRVVPILVLTIAACVFAGGASAARLSLPNPLAIGDVTALQFPGSTTTVHRTLAARPLWGGIYTTPTGEGVNIEVSDTYPQDPAFAQQWADFLSTLIHGPELSKLTLQLAPLNEVQSVCGRFALACYSPDTQTITAPGQDPDPTTSATGIIAHEYGHHLANNQTDYPWAAVDYGTKRWSSYMEVCRSTEHSQMYPGSEDEHYTLNPGEGFAESYRVLNERHLGLPESSWNVVSDIFYPNATALADLQQDITTPWTNPTTSVVRGTFTRRSVAKSFVLGTPLDGAVSATLRMPRTLRARVELRVSGRRVASAVGSGGVKVAHAVACGTRSYAVRVDRLIGYGSYSVTLSRP
jgi:hypothetical protein